MQYIDQKVRIPTQGNQMLQIVITNRLIASQY